MCRLSVNVCGCGGSDPGGDCLVCADPCGAYVVVDFAGEWPFRLINVHAPNDELARKIFLNRVFGFVNDATIVIGDFNITLSKLDVGRNNVYRNDGSRTLLLNLLHRHGLVEVWRALNLTRRGFSRRQVKYVLQLAPMLLQ
uniref:Endonuclease/exonuclease/phosphatase domain-containing protein n=1 Tax=Salarias fasciatus TaxID=181472 RepID=A0A672FUM0_SALFA